jgi:long-subunit fatty acid transport protein
VWLCCSVLAVLAGSAFAGGTDRSGQSLDVLFKPGRQLELSFGAVSSNLSGVEVPALGGQSSGDVAPSYTTMSAAYKADLNRSLAYALVLDQPFGADIVYPTGTGYYGERTTAKMSSTAVTAVLKHALSKNLSLHGGVREQAIDASIYLIRPANNTPYSATFARAWAPGWLVGLAYEKPKKAQRLALTFHSAVQHEMETTETSSSTTLGTDHTSRSKVTIETPRAVNLLFQTGLNAKTLIFGTVRWAEWTKFVVQAPDFRTLTGNPLVSFKDDRTTYTLGLGRRLNKEWSIAGNVGYEATLGGSSSNFAPRDGARNLGIAATYTMKKAELRGGMQYVWVGDAQTPRGTLFPAGNWNDNTGIGGALKLSIKLD